MPWSSGLVFTQTQDWSLDGSVSRHVVDHAAADVVDPKVTKRSVLFVIPDAHKQQRRLPWACPQLPAGLTHVPWSPVHASSGRTPVPHSYIYSR